MIYSREERIRRFKFLVISFSLVIFFLSLLFFLTRGNQRFYGVSLPGSFGSKRIEIVEENQLEKVVTDALAGTRGNYAVVVWNLKTGEKYFSNEEKVFDAASLYKLWVMAETYRQIDKGILSEEEILTEDIAKLNETFDIATESAELKEGELKFSVKSALTQMITISHNYAALMLSKRIRLSNVQLFLTTNGFSSSNVGTKGGLPVTTAKDTALFLEKLYDGKLAGKTSSVSMLALLKEQKINHKIPKYLPKEIPIAHKTGELGLVTHDAGIIYAPSGEYILVVLSESDYPPGAQERIAEVSKAVYEYFSKPSS